MKRFAIAICALCCSVLPAAAHHSVSAYITTTPKAVIGTVKTFEWSNPHTRLIVEVLDPDGKSSEWDFEGPSLVRMTDSGINKNSIVPGDKITVTYGPRRDGKPGGLFMAASYPGGKTLRLKGNRNGLDVGFLPKANRIRTTT